MTSQQIDSLCDEFEAALRRGDTTRIEDYLSQVEEEKRSELLNELLEVEIQFVSEAQKSATSLRQIQESLAGRFPGKNTLIQSLFRHVAKLQHIGDYEILEEIGRGGMGIVYKAKHTLLQQTAAIKVLSQALLDDAQAVGRFRREMQLIGSLDHPNIVRALNAGETDKTHYLVMEFVDGISLHKLVSSVRDKNITNAPAQQNQAVVPLGAACEAIRQAALGLQNAHELKLIHRDIKPANLMLDFRGTVKILDLGLGKFAEEQRTDYHSSLTMEGMVVGTVDYISPEQCENSSDVDIRSDLYSLACTLYFLLSGKPVYSGARYNTMRKKLMGHIVGEIPSIRQEVSGLPGGIETFLNKALAKNPADRFQTPIEFAEALSPFASFDELWKLVGEVIPSDGAASPRDSRYSSPHTALYSSRQSIVIQPASRIKSILFFVCLNLLLCIGLLSFVWLFFGVPKEHMPADHMSTDIDALRETAISAIQHAEKLRTGWHMSDARNEQRQASRNMAEVLFATNAAKDLDIFLRSQVSLAVTQWYLGEIQLAVRTLELTHDQASNIDPNRITLTEQDRLNLDAIRKTIFERRADFRLFGGDIFSPGGSARTGTNRQDDRMISRINRYNEALRIQAEPQRDPVIRWKQAILHALLGNVTEAEKLLNDNPASQNETDEQTLFVRQLAEAVLFYFQHSENQLSGDPDVSRDMYIRRFTQQFTLPSNELRETAMQPGILELLQFASELLIQDALAHEKWDTLSYDLIRLDNITNTFWMKHPESMPFMRRYYELLIRSAVIVHTVTEEPRQQQEQLRTIIRLLERMQLTSSDVADANRATMIYFFLPESNSLDDSFLIYYPQDGRDRVLYRFPISRQMVKQSASGTVPGLPPELLKQVALDQELGSTIHIFWDDTPSWAQRADALTEENYPFHDVLPLR